jgi:hypothetical protein
MTPWYRRRPSRLAPEPRRTVVRLCCEVTRGVRMRLAQGLIVVAVVGGTAVWAAPQLPPDGQGGTTATHERPEVVPATRAPVDDPPPGADARGQPATISPPPEIETAGQPVLNVEPATSGESGEAGLPPAGGPAAKARHHPLPADTEVTIDRKTQLAAGFGFGAPLGASATLSLLHGLAADVRDDSDRVKAVCAAPIAYCARGFLLEAGAGSRGGKLSVGFGGRARIDSDDFHGTVGLGLKLSVARTWRQPGATPDRTYAGPEIDLAVKHVGVGLGLLWRVSGSFRPQPVFSWRVGLVL